MKTDNFCFVMATIIMIASSISLAVAVICVILAILGLVPFYAIFVFLGSAVGGLALSSVMLKLDEICDLLAETRKK